MSGLQSRESESGVDIDDNSDSSSSSDAGPPPLVPRVEYDSSSSSDNDVPPPLVPRVDDDSNSSSSSDNDGPPPLIPRIDYDSSSDDDSLTEKLMPTSTRRKKAKGPAPFGNYIDQAQAKRPKNPPTPTRKKSQQPQPRKTIMDQKRRRAQIQRIRNSALAIASFFKFVYHRKRWERFRSGSIRFQAVWRGISTRRTNAGVIHKVKEFMRFYSIWGNCARLTLTVIPELSDWVALRDQQDFIRQLDQGSNDDVEGLKETDKKLTSSMEDAMKVMEEKAAMLDDDIEEIEGLPVVKPKRKLANEKPTNESSSFKKIHLSADVVKWLKNGDPKYVDFFVRRMKQLSSGERSRILAKRLNGSTTSKMPIYETYLEQKSGFRILWTEKDDFMLVWYVAKHHRVSRLMRLIDDSKNRSERQRVSIDAIDVISPDDNNYASPELNHEILLDPLGNVPLKVYGVGTDEIENITKENWTPTLHLTEEERQVVETEGTVLLLGRSGTGKTICICNRMEFDGQKNEFDRQQNAGDPFFSQLFVSRSPKLCKYVENSISPREGSKFVTFDKIISELERVLPKVGGIRDFFPEDLLMKFSTFKRDVYDGNKGVDALIAWTNIRSFLKGSIEALQNSSSANEFFVSKEDFLSEKNFGKKRCRLATEQRKVVYEIFLTYKEKLAEINAWDNCDRIVALIQRLQAAKRSHPNIFEGLESWCKWSKIYVDEVQDYTQSEILLFFYLSGPGNLFLAGDPAQNVTKGVEFRFDDIRSVGYHIAGENRRLIPQKPKIVNVNFRSHAGILNAAASILSQMFAYFPDSAKQLGRDDGLFKGPRPGILHKIKPETMADLLNQRLSGTVVLTHDECTERVIKNLEGYELVYGIRKAKGLEFKNVIIVDFFSSLPKKSQKPWRELLLNRDIHDYKSKYPEVEGQLKLLYTGVTRCIDRLFFAETSSSMSGDAFLRFMTEVVSDKKNYDKKNGRRSLSICTKNNTENIENLTLTQDEWTASGITNAEAAEADFGTDSEIARSLMEKAIYCFKQAGNDGFEAKARVQASSFEYRSAFFTIDRLGSIGTNFSKDGEDDRTSISELEKTGAKLMEKLLKENLLAEARVLGREVSKMLLNQYPSSPFFERFVMRHLPRREDFKDAS